MNRTSIIPKKYYIRSIINIIVVIAIILNISISIIINHQSLSH